MTGLSLCFTYALAVFALATPAQTSPVIGPEPIRCATCTPEELGQCPAVPANCRVVLKEPGCGCCLACALEKGDSCGVYTAHCATGLHCSPRPGDPRPIHSLTRGHGTCTELEEGEGATSFLSPNRIFLSHVCFNNTRPCFLQTRVQTTGPFITFWI